jgi:hypothetical protein
MLAWRASGGVDALVREFEFPEREAFLAAYPQGYHKTDKKARWGARGAARAWGAAGLRAHVRA